MKETKVEVIGTSERERIASLLLLAFSRDPVMRWMYPDPWRAAQSAE